MPNNALQIVRNAAEAYERLNFHTQMATRLTVEEIKKAVAEVFPTLVGFWDKE